MSGLRGAVGTPDQIREYLRRYEDAGVDQVIFVSQAGRNRHEHIMESLELFGKEVLPEFAERDVKSTRRKADKWAPVVEEVLARRVTGVSRMPDDYVMTALPKQMVDALENEQATRWMEGLADKQAAGNEEELRRLIDD